MKTWLTGCAAGPFDGQLTQLSATHPTWLFPLTWKGAAHPVMGGDVSLIFVGDMCDIFVPHRPKEIVDQVISIAGGSRHVIQFLTKFGPRMAAYFLAPRLPATVCRWQARFWLGFSAEDQRWFDLRWRYVRKLAQAGWTVFVNVGPVLGPVTLPAEFLDLGPRAWVIFSGEQGKREDCRLGARIGRGRCAINARRAACPSICRRCGAADAFRKVCSCANFPK
jgi:protein gp37